MVGRVGENVRGGDRVGCPDDFARLQMPPHIGIIKARAYRQHRKHYERDCQHDREGGYLAKNATAPWLNLEFLGQEHNCHAVPISWLLDSSMRFGSSILIRRCK